MVQRCQFPITTNILFSYINLWHCALAGTSYHFGVRGCIEINAGLNDVGNALSDQHAFGHSAEWASGGGVHSHRNHVFLLLHGQIRFAPCIDTTTQYEYFAETVFHERRARYCRLRTPLATYYHWAILELLQFGDTLFQFIKWKVPCLGNMPAAALRGHAHVQYQRVTMIDQSHGLDRAYLRRAANEQALAERPQQHTAADYRDGE